jgi:hypothetical protein
LGVLVAGCGHGGSSAGTGTGEAARPVMKMSPGPPDFTSEIARKTPQERAQSFRACLKSPAGIKKSYAEVAKKYVDDPDPDVKAAAQELVNAAQ